VEVVNCKYHLYSQRKLTVKVQIMDHLREEPEGS